MDFAFDSKEAEFEFIALLVNKAYNAQTTALLKQAYEVGYFDTVFATHYKNIIKTLVIAYISESFTYEYVKGRLSPEEQAIIDQALRTTPNVYSTNKYFSERINAFLLYKLVGNIADIYEKSTKTGTPIPVNTIKKKLSEYQDALSASASFDEIVLINDPHAEQAPDKESVLSTIKKKAGFLFYADELPTLADASREFSYPTCGLSLLDNLMTGKGLEPGRLVTYVGLPGHGKSIMLLQAAIRNFERGLNVAFFTLENTTNETMQRLIAHVNKIDKNIIFSSKQNYDTAWTKTEEFINSSPGSLIVTEYPPATLTPVEIFNKVLQLQETHKLRFDIIIIDYLDLLTTPRRYNDRRHELKAIYSDTKKLAKMYMIPVITASQLNRAATREKKIHVDNISEAFSKVEISDLVILMRSNTQSSGDIVDMFIGKSRITQAYISVRGFMRKPYFTFDEQTIVMEHDDSLIDDIELTE